MNTSYTLITGFESVYILNVNKFAEHLESIFNVSRSSYKTA